MAGPDIARLIAFYLPQFHPIPENDSWWGRGFTEWTNVASARPLFPEHAQPDLPADLGFYDLRLPEVREAQAELARTYGIHGFCYYHYWFNGRRLVERPFNEVLATGKPDLPFCLCWANENWTRTWDGMDRDVLIQQHGNSEDDRQHFQWLAPALCDPRYIRVDGKPLLLVYRSSRLINPAQTVSIWRDEARALGVGDIFLATVESLEDDRADHTRMGFDAGVEFQPDWLNLGAPMFSFGAGNSVHSYETLVERALAKPPAGYRQFRCVATGWDNTPRRRQNARIFTDSTPELYQRWLEGVIAASPRLGEPPVVFINAWNEWAEGAHLEPCQRWGRAYLEATRRALAGSVGLSVEAAIRPRVRARSIQRPIKLSVCIPTYNGASFLADAIRSVLAQSTEDLEILVVDDCSTDGSVAVAKSIGDTRIRHLANPVRLGLAGNWNRCVEVARGEYICVFHQDDVMAPDNLREKNAFLDAHPSAGFVHSNVLQIGPQGEVLSRWWYAEPTPEDEGLHHGYDYFKTLLTGPNLVSCPSVLMRRACYEQVGRFDPELPFTADWEMWMRAALFFDVGYLIQPLVHYRRHDRQETQRFLGLRELEHASLAKLSVLNTQRGRIPDHAALKADVLAHYRDAALSLLQKYLLDDARLESLKCLSFAMQLQAARGESEDAADDWFGRIADNVLSRVSEVQGFPQSATASELTARRSAERLALEHARNEVVALHDSLSWRVTRPLRAAYAAVLKLKSGKRSP